VTDDGTVMYETADEATTWMTDDGTYDGTSDESTMYADGDDPIEIKAELGNDETHEAGTTTGDEKLDGTTIDDGTKTYELTAIDVMADDGMVKAADDGTDDGTFDQATTANPLVDKTITWVDGTSETRLNGKTTGDENPVLGITTVDGTVTYETADDGTV
jgi:hypothetical protein